MIKSIALNKIKPGDVIRAHIAPFKRPNITGLTNNDNWFLTTFPSNWKQTLTDVTLTIGAIKIVGEWLVLETLEYGKIATWVDTVKYVKCYTVKKASEVIKKIS